MAAFQKLRIDLSQTLDASAAKKIADPPGFSASVAKEVSSGNQQNISPCITCDQFLNLTFRRTSIALSHSYTIYPCILLAFSGRGWRYLKKGPNRRTNCGQAARSTLLRRHVSSQKRGYDGLYDVHGRLSIALFLHYGNN